ncbi:MAG: transposase [Candidatus Paceibacterota bacterium]
MLFLYSHHIVDLYYWVDQQIDTKPYVTGRPALLSESEVITILIWNTIVLKQKTLKDIHDTILVYHNNDFKLPKYSAFVNHCHKALPQMYYLLNQLLGTTEAIRLIDSTMLPVCKNHRVDRYKVAKNIADFGKNWQGWHYGFKLHASVALDGRLCGMAFTLANIHDAQVMTDILNEHCVVAGLFMKIMVPPLSLHRGQVKRKKSLPHSSYGYLTYVPKLNVCLITLKSIYTWLLLFLVLYQGMLFIMYECY